MKPDGSAALYPGMEQVALVTGGAKGIGAAIASRLLRDGWRVVVADRDPVAESGIRSVVCDVSDEAAVGALLRSVEATEGRLDALVCNAGFMIRKPIADLTLAEWSAVLATNLTSTFLLVRAAEAMLARGKGRGGHHRVVPRTHVRAGYRVVFRVQGRAGGADACAGDQPGPGCAGQLHQPRLGRHQGAGAVGPGARIPSGRTRRAAGRYRLHSPAFLVGPDSAFITGAEFVVDGGVTRKMIYPE